MYITAKICSFDITAESEKEAYIKGCKKAASMVASKKYKNTSMKVERSREGVLTFTILTNIDLGQDYKMFCKMCKEMHCSFYINENYNCDSCNLKAFLNRIEEKAKVSKSFYKREFTK